MESADVTLSEAKSLMREWTGATFQTRADSIRHHFDIHGAGVEAANVWQYFRKARGFHQHWRGTTKVVLDEGKVRYTKRGRYLIFDAQRKIVSFGSETPHLAAMLARHENVRIEIYELLSRLLSEPLETTNLSHKAEPATAHSL